MTSCKVSFHATKKTRETCNACLVSVNTRSSGLSMIVLTSFSSPVPLPIVCTHAPKRNCVLMADHYRCHGKPPVVNSTCTSTTAIEHAPLCYLFFQKTRFVVACTQETEPQLLFFFFFVFFTRARFNRR